MKILAYYLIAYVISAVLGVLIALLSSGRKDADEYFVNIGTCMIICFYAEVIISAIWIIGYVIHQCFLVAIN